MRKAFIRPPQSYGAKVASEHIQVNGANFDAQSLPQNVTSVAIYTVRKGELPNLEGLQDLAIKSLELRWISAPDLTHVPLPNTLEELTIWHSPKLRSCTGIESAPRLKRLKWWDTGMLEDSRALGTLSGLKRLQLTAGMNEKQKVRDLDFLMSLQLEVLDLNGIAPHDLEPDPVLAQRRLKQIYVNGADWEIESLAKLAARFPVLHPTFEGLEDYPRNLGMACKSCKGRKKVLRMRKRKFLWCPVCEEKSLKKTLATFDKMVEDARQSGVEPLPDVQLFEE